MPNIQSVPQTPIKKAEQEALNCWNSVREAAQVFGIRREDYISQWIHNVYGSLSEANE